MLLQSPYTKVYVAAKPTDMRKSFHGLLLEVQSYIEPHQIYEALFLFFSKTRDRVKILHYDSNGFALWYKLLDVGIYQRLTSAGVTDYVISLEELNNILTDIKPSRRNSRNNTRKTKPFLIN